MNNYEIFTEEWSTIVSADNMQDALKSFYYRNKDEKVIAIVDCAYPEFLENQSQNIKQS